MAKTGASEKSATRVVSSTAPFATSISTEGTAKRPRPATTVAARVLPRGQDALYASAATAAMTANKASGTASLAKGEEYATRVEPGRRSERSAAQAHRKQSNNNALTGAAFVLSLGKCRPFFRIKTQCCTLAGLVRQGPPIPPLSYNEDWAKADFFEVQQGVSRLWRFPPPKCVRA